MSGFAHEPPKGADGRTFPVLMKPFRPDAFVDSIRAALA